MFFFENELENFLLILFRIGSLIFFVNGDIKVDLRNKLIDKFLDKDLYLFFNGVCGIDLFDIDFFVFDGERFSSSKVLLLDFFGSEINLDFGKYLEESDIDMGLFSDVL